MRLILLLVVLPLLVLWRLWFRRRLSLLLRPRLRWWLVLRRTITRGRSLRPGWQFVLSRLLSGTRVLRRRAGLYRTICRRLCRWTIRRRWVRFRTVRLSRRRTIIARRRFGWTIRLRRSIRFRSIWCRRICFRTVWLSGGRVIVARWRLKGPIGLRRPIRRLIRRRLVWLRPIWRSSRRGTLVRIRIPRPICGLIRRRVRRLIHPIRWLIAGMGRDRYHRRRRRLSRRCLPHDGLRRGRISRPQALHLLPRYRLAGMRCEYLLFRSK